MSLGNIYISSVTSSCHHFGLPTGLIPLRFQSNSFLVGLAWFILWICPSHLILCALMNLTKSAPSINLSISMLFHILHILSILTGPNIFLSVCLSRMCRLLPSFTSKNSPQYYGGVMHPWNHQPIQAAIILQSALQPAAGREAVMTRHNKEKCMQDIFEVVVVRTELELVEYG